MALAGLQSSHLKAFITDQGRGSGGVLSEYPTQQGMPMVGARVFALALLLLPVALPAQRAPAADPNAEVAFGTGTHLPRAG